MEYLEYMHNAFVGEAKFSHIVKIKYTFMWLPKNVRHKKSVKILPYFASMRPIVNT